MSHAPLTHVRGAQQSASDLQTEVRWQVLSHASAPEGVGHVTFPKSERSHTSDCESMLPSPHSSNASQKISSLRVTATASYALWEGRKLPRVASSKSLCRLNALVSTSKLRHSLIAKPPVWPP